jgi:hypothetical protein
MRCPPGDIMNYFKNFIVKLDLIKKKKSGLYRKVFYFGKKNKLRGKPSTAIPDQLLQRS